MTGYGMKLKARLGMEDIILLQRKHAEKWWLFLTRMKTIG